MIDRRTSPLDAVHRGLGARMVLFGGWEMPLSYPTGTLAEHASCREGAALFDVSHLGTLEVLGNGALDLLQATLSNDLTRIGPGRAQYTHLLDETDGSVLDDIIVWWLGEGRFWVLPNATNNAAVVGALPGCVDLGTGRALLALQGPRAREVLEAASPAAAEVGRCGKGGAAGFEAGRRGESGAADARADRKGPGAGWRAVASTGRDSDAAACSGAATWSAPWGWNSLGGG